MKQWVSIVGARPQFIKLAPLCEAVAEWNKLHPDQRIQHRIIHTGQHYDTLMSDVFFQSLSIPKPDYSLDAGSGSHAEQTAAILVGVERVLMGQTPDMVLLYGDTNSTVAGALAAAKLAIPIAHIEAGLRSGQRHMPEEINRVVTDRLASVLFCSSERGKAQLAREGIERGVYVSGDIMYDILKRVVASDLFAAATLPEGLKEKSFLLLTLHRAETTADPEELISVLNVLDDYSRRYPVYFPVHPRTRQVLQEFRWKPKSPHFYLGDPLSYSAMLKCAQQAALVLTDSGGLQKEAYWLGTLCITLRDTTEWQELVEAGWNRVVGLDAGKIKEAIDASLENLPAAQGRDVYGTGKAAPYIVATLAGSA